MFDTECKIDECCSLPSSIRFQETSHTTEGSDDVETNRYAVANRAFRAGDVIIRNVPLSCALTRHQEAEKQQRCAYCFATHSDANRSLSRCGRCKSIWYCSRDCQKLDFGLHKVECAYFCSSNRPTQTLQSDRAVAEICLLIRTFAFISSQRNTKKETEQSLCTRKHNATDCGIDHLLALARYTLPLDPVDQLMIQEATNAIWAKRQKDTSATTEEESIRQQVENLARIFRVNNFGITDDLSAVIASAVYPLGALLNHSCRPNCLLRYDDYSDSQGTTNKHPPILEIVAHRDIQQGEELTHSYVELVQPIGVRQEKLLSNYGFKCECDRCTIEHGARSSWSDDGMDLLQLQEPNIIRQWLDYFDPNNSNTTSKPSSSYQPRSIDTSSTTSLRHAIDQSRKQAKQCMAMDDLQGELDSLSNASNLLCQLLAREHQRQSTSGGTQSSTDNVNVELYEVRGELLGVQIVASQLDQALETCECMVAFLASIFCSARVACPNHPILGLQLFTLGDLYQAKASEQDKGSFLDYEARAQQSFLWARTVLSVSHSENSKMFILLRDKISS
eukprot:scaffold24_cov128-Cylindrotheca_fusiformis.AAC.28